MALITLDVPRKRNAISAAMAVGLDAAVERAAAAAGAIVITGAGGAFSAGMDLDDVGAGVEIPLGFIEHIAALEVPVVAAIGGAAATGGLELALACHFRIGCAETVLLDRHAQLGLFPRAGMSARLVGLVGPGAALEISLTGRRVGAEEALRLGLLDRLAPSEGLVDEALATAAAMATVDPELRRRLIALYREAAELPPAEALRREREANAAWHRISGGREGARERFRAGRGSE
ncbi:MAG TPA: enoyl-CoA hydratase-related protein [Solirubrobacterales bacterium]|nr:enoyl-CoA hydratase-related protein [Solirubrobacterales bacterium]